MHLILAGLPPDTGLTALSQSSRHCRCGAAAAKPAQVGRKMCCVVATCCTEQYKRDKRPRQGLPTADWGTNIPRNKTLMTLLVRLHSKCRQALQKCRDHDCQASLRLDLRLAKRHRKPTGKVKHSSGNSIENDQPLLKCVLCDAHRDRLPGPRQYCLAYSDGIRHER